MLRPLDTKIKWSLTPLLDIFSSFEIWSLSESSISHLRPILFYLSMSDDLSDCGSGDWPRKAFLSWTRFAVRMMINRDFALKPTTLSITEDDMPGLVEDDGYNTDDSLPSLLELEDDVDGSDCKSVINPGIEIPQRGFTATEDAELDEPINTAFAFVRVNVESNSEEEDV